MAGKGGSLGKNGRMKAHRIKIVPGPIKFTRGNDHVTFTPITRGRHLMENSRGEKVTMKDAAAYKRMSRVRDAGFKGPSDR